MKYCYDSLSLTQLNNLSVFPPVEITLRWLETYDARESLPKVKDLVDNCQRNLWPPQLLGESLAAWKILSELSRCLSENCVENFMAEAL